MTGRREMSNSSTYIIKVSKEGAFKHLSLTQFSREVRKKVRTGICSLRSRYQGLRKRGGNGF